MAIKVSSAGRIVLAVGIFLMAILTGVNIMFATSPLAGLQQGLIFFILAAFLFVEWAYEGKEKLLDIDTYKKPLSILTISVVIVSLYFALALTAYNQISPALISLASFLAFLIGIMALFELFN